MIAKVFVDTNIWLYSLIETANDDRHRQAVNFLFGLTRPVISSQVIGEICNNLIKKVRLPEQQLRVLIEGWYQSCEVISVNKAQHRLASKLRESYSLSYWDSMIVAAALDAGCAQLYSEDMQHGQVFEQCLTLLNPFIAS